MNQPIGFLTVRSVQAASDNQSGLEVLSSNPTRGLHSDTRPLESFPLIAAGSAFANRR
jgi:hypothetical protein